MTGEDIRVSYGVKELLGRIDIRLESIDGKLDAKADVREVADLRERVDSLERREEARIVRERTTRDQFSRREKIIGLLLAGAAVMIQLLLVRYQLLGG